MASTTPLVEQLSFLDAPPAAVEPERPRFHGATFVAERDEARLLPQGPRIRSILLDGAWWTLNGLHRESLRRFGKYDPEASISARLRDCCQVGERIEREYVKGGNGLWRYRLRNDDGGTE